MKSILKVKEQDQTLPAELIWEKEFDLSIQKPFVQCLDYLYGTHSEGIVVRLRKVNIKILSEAESAAYFVMSLGGGLSAIWLVASLECSTDDTTLLRGKAGIDAKAVLLFMGLALLIIYASTFFSKSVVAGCTGVSIGLLIFGVFYFSFINTRNYLTTRAKCIFL